MLNRPYAFVQWCEKAKIPERYVLMAEPDHIFLRPLPNFMNGDAPGACGPALGCHWQRAGQRQCVWWGGLGRGVGMRKG